MFSLLHGFYQELTQLPQLKLLILGLDASGKSSLLEWLKTLLPYPTTPPNPLPSPSPTVGLNVAKLRTNSHALLVWDLGGQEPLRPIWDRYIQEADALIWVVDTADSTRLDESRDVLREVIKKGALENKPLLVYANKQDVDGAVDPVHISLQLALVDDVEKRSQCIQPCSAKTGEGIREGLIWLVDSMATGGKTEMRIP